MEPASSRTGTFRTRLAVTSLAQGSALLLTAAFILIASRWLGPSGKGVHAVLLSAGQLLALVLSFGVGASMPYVVSSDVRRAPMAARRLARLVLAVSAILLFLSVANQVGHLLPALIGREAVVSTFVVLSIANQGLATLALSAGRVRAFNISALVAVGVSLLALPILLAIEQITPEAVIAVQGLGLGAASAYVLVDLWRQGLLSPGFARGVGWISQRSAALFGYAAALLTLLMLRIDIFLVTAIAGLAAGGIYSVAVAVAELMLRLPHWSSFLLMPIVAQKGAAARLQTARLFWLSMAFAACLFLITVVFARPIESLIVLVLGADFAPLLLVLFATFPRIILQSGSTILVGNLAGWGYTIYPPMATALGLVLVTVADLVLIPQYGLVGAGLGASVAAGGTLVVVTLGFLRLNRMSFRAFVSAAGARGSQSEQTVSVG